MRLPATFRSWSQERTNVAEINKEPFTFQQFPYQLLNALTGLLFPLITYPYLARILGPERLGAVNFVEYSAGLIWSLASIGIPAYGVNRIAQLKALHLSKRRIFWQLAGLHTLTGVIGYGILFFLLKDRAGWNFIQILLPIGFLHVFFNCLSADWYLQGIQRFDISAYRTLILRILTVCSIFLLVHESDDFLAYYWIIVLTYILTAAFNGYWIKKDLETDAPSGSNTQIEWRELLFFFGGSVFLSCTDFLDATVLGIFSNEEQLGYYSNALKLIRISLVLTLALNVVVYPLFAQYKAMASRQELESVLSRSLNWLLYLTIPICVLYGLYAEPLVQIIAGSSFAGSIPMVQWMAPIPLFIGVSNLLIFYGLSASTGLIKRRIVRGVLAGLLVSVVLNRLLIESLGGLGTAINTLIIECGFSTFFWILLKPRVDLTRLVTTLLTCLTFIPIYWGLSKLPIDDLSKLLICGISSFSTYILLQHHIWKHSFLTEITQLYFSKNKP